MSLRPKARPPLKWAGGKRWLLKSIQELWRPYETLGSRFVEPFCGGLAITLGLMPKRGHLNDINPHLINFYNQLKSGLTANLKMEYDKALYYTYRQRFNDLIKQNKWKSPEAALLFYYLNHTGYNGLCRFNQKGLFNVPFGEYKTVTYMKDFEYYRLVFRDWQFTSTDFEEVLIESSDFVYADPPYDVEFRQYSSQGFGWPDQVRLAKWIKSLNIPAVISNQATDRIIKLYKSMNFELKFLSGPRMISCKGDRTPAREVLAIKVL
ncbi:MAG: Dam family site-specific DNA-(adenine-N6)-methyltransferase [Thaumarchaeota archaeon]|nr:MAG: Dam family site-specific DNA-(adenine-N6)-methyltransferase [Nitrososphaerota archaeon]